MLKFPGGAPSHIELSVSVLHSLYIEFRLIRSDVSTPQPVPCPSELPDGAVADLDLYGLWINRQRTVRHKLMLKGLEVGTLSLFARIEKPYTMHQIIGGLYSNGRFVSFSSAITASTSAENPKIKEVIYRTKILSDIFSAKDNLPEWDLDASRLRSFEKDVLEAYSALHTLCSSSERSTRNIFTYNNHDSLMQGTEAFLNLIDLMYERREALEPFEKMPYYKLLYVVADRGELKIDAIDFKQDAAYNMNEKVRVNKKLYQTFVKLLRGAKNDTNANMTKDQVRFNCQIMVQMIFRLPEFRGILVKKVGGVSLTEFGSEGNNIQTLVLDANRSMISNLKTKTDLSESSAILKPLLEEFQDFEFDPFIFLNFLVEFMSFLNQFMVARDFNFHHVFGYEAFRDKFIEEFLVSQRTENFSAVTAAAYAMMADSKNLQLFVQEMLRFFDPKKRDQVELFYRILSHCGAYYADHKENFPVRFKLDWIEENIAALVREDQVVGIFASINFVYKYFYLFHDSVQRGLIKLFTRLVSLLLHWDQGVQKLVANLIFYRFFLYNERKGDVSAEIVLFIRAFLVFKIIGEDYKQQLRVWEHKSTIFKKKHSLLHMKRDLTQKFEELQLKVDPYDSIYASVLNLNGRTPLNLGRLSFSPIYIEEGQVIYCEPTSAMIETTFKTYKDSKFRETGDEDFFPQVAHMLNLDKKEPKNE